MHIDKHPLLKSRGIIVLAVAALIASAPPARPADPADSTIGARDTATIPRVSRYLSPPRPIAPVARDGHRGRGYLRKPPGDGPFPAVVLIHGGLTARPDGALRQYLLDTPQPSRFLAAGYVVAVITYRSRDHDPQSRVSASDSLAAIDFVRRIPNVDSRSIGVFGCSGGGDLALEIAAAADVAAIVPEEPAGMLFTGVFNRDSPRRGKRYTPRDVIPITEDPLRHYTQEHQNRTREKIAGLRAPILLLQGDKDPLNHFNALVLIPELRAAGKKLEVVTYAGEPHCFAFDGGRRGGTSPGSALKAFRDVDAFLRRHIATQPVALDRSIVRHVPLPK